MKGSLATAVAAIGIAAAGASSASAWPVDHPRVVGVDVDFGSTWSGALAAPMEPGERRWDTGGIVTPTLSGRLYMVNSNGLRGRLRIDYYDAAYNRITLRHSRWRIRAPAGTRSTMWTSPVR